VTPVVLQLNQSNFCHHFVSSVGEVGEGSVGLASGGEGGVGFLKNMRS